MRRSALISLDLLAIALLFTLAGHTLHHGRTASVAAAAETSAALLENATSSIRVPILVYHSVMPDPSHETKWQASFNVPPTVLEEQLSYLEQHGYTVISMDQLVADIKAGTTTPVSKPVVLTFDDGWKNQYTYAFPLLQKHQMTATFYIYTKPISTYPDFMTWEQLKELHDAGMTIGAHTLTHPQLSSLTPDQLLHEIFDSKTILESHLGVPVIHFASPYGYSNPEIVSLLEHAGFTTGRTLYKGTTHAQDDDLHLTAYLVDRDVHNFEWILQYAP